MADDIRAAKQELRARILQKRDDLAPDFRATSSAFLQDHRPLFGDVKGKMVSSFWPIRSEINPTSLTRVLKADGAHLCLPVVMDKTTLAFRAYDSDDDLIDAGFGTKGPSARARVVDPDIMLVPLAVFDGDCGRIGYGAGFYDRAIARLRAKGKAPRTFGIAFAEQEVAHVPQDEFDIQLDCILTPSGVINAPRKGA